ncbi:hypothetical protein BaRGS_00018524 [Batillaria attramentaria]|uniref:Uncharacterized protein n=1 Tax=Batillaria attramentaria TaxID=370345 RepID=A0ABD0KTE8_9CAEN
MGCTTDRPYITRNQYRSSAKQKIGTPKIPPDDQRAEVGECLVTKERGQRVAKHIKTTISIQGRRRQYRHQTATNAMNNETLIRVNGRDADYRTSTLRRLRQENIITMTSGFTGVSKRNAPEERRTPPIPTEGMPVYSSQIPKYLK